MLSIKDVDQYTLEFEIFVVRLNHFLGTHLRFHKAFYIPPLPYATVEEYLSLIGRGSPRP
jgi:hypothetical protein